MVDEERGEQRLVTPTTCVTRGHAEPQPGAWLVEFHPTGGLSQDVLYCRECYTALEALPEHLEGFVTNARRILKEPQRPRR